eukprot:jgi/Mesvir1/1077/Mv17592-RA.1
MAKEKGKGKDGPNDDEADRKLAFSRQCPHCLKSISSPISVPHLESAFTKHQNSKECVNAKAQKQFDADKRKHPAQLHFAFSNLFAKKPRQEGVSPPHFPGALHEGSAPGPSNACSVGSLDPPQAPADPVPIPSSGVIAGDACVSVSSLEEAPDHLLGDDELDVSSPHESWPDVAPASQPRPCAGFMMDVPDPLLAIAFQELKPNGSFIFKGAFFSSSCEGVLADCGGGTCNRCAELQYNGTLKLIQARGRLAANDPALDSVNYKFLSVRQLRERLEELLRQRNEWKLAHLNVSRRVAVLSKQVDMDQQFMLAIRDNSVPRIRQLVSVALRRGRSVQFIVHQMGQAIKGLYRAKGFASDDKARDLGALVAATGGGKLLAALNKDGNLPARAALAVQGVTFCADLKHLLKRFRTRVISRLKGVQVRDVTLTREDLYNLLEKAGVSTLAALFEPVDKQNVPAAVKLLEAVASLRLGAHDLAVTAQDALTAARLLGSLFEGLIAPLRQLNLDLGRQLELASRSAHLLFVLYRLVSTKLVPSVLYHDTMVHITTLFSNVMKIQAYFPGQRYYIFQQGTDREELVFGDARTQSHNNTFTVLEAHDRFATAAQIRGIYEKHPEWQTPSRLLVRSYDHINTKSITGDMTVTPALDVAGCFERGAQEAALTLAQSGWWDADAADLDFTTLYNQGVSLRCPFRAGEIVGVTARVGDEVEEAEEVGAAEATLDSADLASSSLPNTVDMQDPAAVEAVMLDDATITLEDALRQQAAKEARAQSAYRDGDEDTVAAVPVLPTFTSRLEYLGKTIRKTTALRILTTSLPGRSSSDRLRRVQTMEKATTHGVVGRSYRSRAVIICRDAVATLVRCQGHIALAVIEARTLQVPTAKGALFTVPDLIEEQLGYPDTTVTGPMLYLSPERAIAGASDGEGAGHEGENLDLPLPRFARRGWCSETTCKVTLTSKRGGVQATVACSSFTKFNYASAAKYSKSSPCTNVPRVCGVCPGGNTIVWSYDYLNHLQLKHAERPCTLDEIEKYAITGLECREVLNKYLGISFEKVFLPKLKVQVGLLRDTSEVALFWKKVLGDL